MPSKKDDERDNKKSALMIFFVAAVIMFSALSVAYVAANDKTDDGTGTATVRISLGGITQDEFLNDYVNNTQFANWNWAKDGNDFVKCTNAKNDLKVDEFKEMITLEGYTCMVSSHSGDDTLGTFVGTFGLMKL